jgi:hypothetical protein
MSDPVVLISHNNEGIAQGLESQLRTHRPGSMVRKLPMADLDRQPTHAWNAIVITDATSPLLELHARAWIVYTVAEAVSMIGVGHTWRLWHHATLGDITEAVDFLIEHTETTPGMPPALERTLPPLSSASSHRRRSGTAA